VILSCNGQRTMRTCLEGAAALTADDLSADDFAGSAWAFFSAYGLYQPGLLPRAMGLAKQVSCCKIMYGVGVVAAPVACLVQDHNAVSARR
jgi:sugar/nucleoside kinase (ribokinase family)